MRWQKTRRVLFRVGLSVALAFIVAAALIVADGLCDDARPADVCIIPGNTVGPDGRPSARLRARLDKAVELYRAGVFPNVIVSGGVGSEGFDEALVMKAYLIEQGLPGERVYVDGGGATTYLTARNASRLMRENGWRSALVVSQYFHIPRTKLALRRSGVSEVYSAHARYFELRDFYSIAREVVGYGGYLLRSFD